MTSPDPLQTFFQDCERAIAPQSSFGPDHLYHSSFLFAGPQGAQTVKLEDFLRALPRMTAAAQARGVVATRLQSCQSTPWDDRYTQVRVCWRLTIRQPDQSFAHQDAWATYLLMQTAEGWRIIAQVDHQDLD